ncbi:flagellar basal body L-ring protein [Zobellella denitrificans]|uniref:Flagellar L-ring protein n=1 Tax=Zobellella denitrificans TaxID=347534 RepID=A0A231MVK6_9GAMM|nr:flagellar basal body L-ring protein FlgH [Zobellella denitrificans]ATG74961.1 flagellar basal body L-ring protein [Zobellella denitrificans]OXS14254.1 flagellar basal body L-ring protein [Zobellella denitrificans]
MMKKLRHWLWAGLLGLAGCTTYELIPPEPGEEDWAPTLGQTSQAEPGRDGSAFSQNSMITLFQDRRAYRVGDILTITLEERTQSSKKADTSMGKNSGIDIPAPMVGRKLRTNLTLEGSVDRDFRGSASTSQQNTLSGSITVTVAEVLPNGVLRVRGEKWIRLNQGDEYVRLNGLVRVDDIDGQNRVSSQRLADARITYAGRGALADTNQAGWLTRFFNSSWFPL